MFCIQHLHLIGVLRELGLNPNILTDVIHSQSETLLQGIQLAVHTLSVQPYRIQMSTGIRI